MTEETLFPIPPGVEVVEGALQAAKIQLFVSPTSGSLQIIFRAPDDKPFAFGFIPADLAAAVMAWAASAEATEHAGNATALALVRPAGRA